MKRPLVVAEIGAVHLGSLQRAKDLARLARLCEADYIKTQKRNPEESTPPHLWNQPHPNAIFAHGKTYLEHRKNLELSIEQHQEFKAYCDQIGIKYASSVWDITSAREIISLQPDFIKVPSACNRHFGIHEILRDEYNGDIHISFGMTTHAEREDVIDFWRTNSHRVVFYHCTSAYPCPFEKLYLMEIQNLRTSLEPYGFRIGFSNHGYGIAADIAAMTLGAEWIERHFVDDRTLRHTDAAASLESDGLRRVCRDLRNVHRAMLYRPLKLDDLEKEQRDKLRFDGVSKRVIVNGKAKIVESDNLTYDEVVALADGAPGVMYSVIYSKGKDNDEGILSPRMNVHIVNGMVFSSVLTGSA